jgi:hypothetical protein
MKEINVTNTVPVILGVIIVMVGMIMITPTLIDNAHENQNIKNGGPNFSNVETDYRD